jgi:hypothetical protein
MKTRIFTTTAMLILAIQLIAGTTNMNQKDSTMVLAYVSPGKNSFETSAGNNVFHSDMNNSVTVNVLEEWIAARESWEQEGSEATAGNFHMEPVNLEEWISERESWEQGSETARFELIEAVSLDEWVASRQNWEQEGYETKIAGFPGKSDILKAWVSERENWEKK